MNAVFQNTPSVIDEVKQLHLRVKIALVADRISTLVKFRDLALRQMAQTKTRELQHIYEEMVKDIVAATREHSQLQDTMKAQDPGFF